MAKKFLIFLIIFLIVFGLKISENVEAVSQTRYFRSASQTVNGLQACSLGTSQTGNVGGMDVNIYSGNVYVTQYVGIRVWKCSANCNNSANWTEIGTAGTVKAIASGSTSGLISATWNVPSTNLTPTDIIIVKFYVGDSSPPSEQAGWAPCGPATFITEQLNTAQLLPKTWTVYYYLLRTYYSGSNVTKYEIKIDTSLYATRIENFSFNSAPSITSVSDSPDPQKGGSAVTFTSTASDPDAGDTIKLYVCKDSSCTNCNPSNTSNCWAVGSGVTATGSPQTLTASYTCPSCTAATNNYWAKVCDQNGACSGIITSGDGSFTCKKENACSCSAADQCYNPDNPANPGYCADGYCCNSACTGTCQQCNFPGSLGTCRTRQTTDPNPNEECASCFYCDGININCQPVTCPAGQYCVDSECIKPNLHGFAWSENIGWISFNSKNCDLDGDGVMDRANGLPPNGDQGAPTACPPDGTIVKPYGVYLPIGLFSEKRFFKGYAWSSNVGWIKFNPPGPYPSGDCADSAAYLQFDHDTYGWIRACAGAANADCTGGANPAAGGWDGWICVSDLGQDEVNWEGVTLNTATDPDEFQGWAWGGGGTNTQNAVIGWISWNCKDREAATGKTCVDNVTDPNTQLWNYKVTYQPENSAPTVSNAQITGINYCTERGDSKGIQKGNVGLSWTYLDFEGDDQERYWLQIATDLGFSNKIIDCQVPNSVAVDPNVAKTMTSSVDVVSPTSTEYANRCNDGGDLGSRTLAISYNGTYYWRVRSKAATGNTNWSNWAVYGAPTSFSTPVHAYPWSDFSWDPLYPAVFQNVTFDAQPGTLTRFYDTTCAVDPTNASCSYSWTFTDAYVNPNPPPPPKYQEDAKFQTAGAKPVTLQVTDSSGFSCSTTKSVQVGLPLPQWKEIPPTF